MTHQHVEITRRFPTVISPKSVVAPGAFVGLIAPIGSPPQSFIWQIESCALGLVDDGTHQPWGNAFRFDKTMAAGLIPQNASVGVARAQAPSQGYAAVEDFLSQVTMPIVNEITVTDVDVAHVSAIVRNDRAAPATAFFVANFQILEIYAPADGPGWAARKCAASASGELPLSGRAKW